MFLGVSMVFQEGFRMFQGVLVAILRDFGRISRVYRGLSGQFQEHAKVLRCLKRVCHV